MRHSYASCQSGRNIFPAVLLGVAGERGVVSSKNRQLAWAPRPLFARKAHVPVLEGLVYPNSYYIVTKKLGRSHTSCSASSSSLTPTGKVFDLSSRRRCLKLHGRNNEGAGLPEVLITPHSDNQNMSAIPTEPDSVYAVILCFGQGDAARQALRDNPLYVMQGGLGLHAGGEDAAALSRVPPALLRHSSSLPSLASRRAMDTDTPIPDGADLEHENAGNNNEDGPSLGGSPLSRASTASLGDTGTPNASLEHLPLLAAGPAGDPEPFAPQMNAPAAVLVQEGLAPGQGVLDQFLHDEPDEVDGMDDDDDLPGLDGFLLDLNDGPPVADNLPTALEALIGTTTLLQLNELPQHPNRLQLVMALYTALVHYMPLHGLPLDIQPPAIAAAQEQEEQLDDLVDPDGPFEDEDVHAQDDVANQDAGHDADDEAPAYDAVQAPGPDAVQDADLPALIPEPAEPEVAIANAALGPAPDIEVMPRTDTGRDVSSVIDSTGTQESGGDTDLRQAHEPVPGNSVASDALQSQTQASADALSWLYDRFSLQGERRNVDEALNKAAARLRRLERKHTARNSSSHEPQDPARVAESSPSANEKATPGRKFLRGFLTAVKWKPLRKQHEMHHHPSSSLPSRSLSIKQ